MLDPLLSRLAWTSTFVITILAIVTFIVWLADDLRGGRPLPLFLGWDLLQKGISLVGGSTPILQGSVGFLSLAFLIALLTKGFNTAGIWGRITLGLLVLGGVVALIPLLLIGSVLVFNIFLWLAIAALTSLLVMLWVPLAFLFLPLKVRAWWN